MLRIAFATAVACLLLVSAAAAQPLDANEIRVTDGDTIFAHGKVYRLVGFNAPETFKARCAEERSLGVKAHTRLQALINAGNLELTEVRCSCRPGTEGTNACNFGRSCAVLKAKALVSLDRCQAIMRRSHARI